MPTPKNFNPLGAFWAKVDRSGGIDACWPYMGARDTNGYGSVGRGGRDTRAHRYSYELAYGPINSRLFVCHKCDNPPCCNPAHLFLGTQSDNLRDCYAKGRRACTLKRDGVTRRGHLNMTTRARFARIIQSLLSGTVITARYIRSEFGVGRATAKRDMQLLRGAMPPGCRSVRIGQGSRVEKIKEAA